MEENVPMAPLTKREKDALSSELASCLSSEKEIRKVVIFGSFIHSSNPHDMDVAVFQESNESYLPLALRYRKKARRVSRKIPLDIFPFREGADSPFQAEIDCGMIIYER